MVEQFTENIVNEINRSRAIRVLHIWDRRLYQVIQLQGIINKYIKKSNKMLVDICDFLCSINIDSECLPENDEFVVFMF